MATATTDLRKRVILVSTPIAAVLVALGAYAASRITAREFMRPAEGQLQATVQRAAELVDLYMEQRRSDLELLAGSPAVVDAARAATAEALDLGFDRYATEELESQFAEEKAMGRDQRLRNYLVSFRDASEFAEISFTERNGFTVLASNPTSDFVQSDEEWWRDASLTGWYEGTPANDASAGVLGLELAARINDPDSGVMIGVVRGLVDLSRLAELLSAGQELTLSTVDVVDSTGSIMIASEAGRLFTTAQRAQDIPRQEETAVVSIPGELGGELVASRPANGSKWWVLVRQRQEVAHNAASSIRDSIYVVAGFGLFVAILLLAGLTEWLHRSVTQPVRVAGTVATRIADGDLSVGVAASGGVTGEVSNLMGAVRSMVDSLRKLVGEMRTSAQESAAMAEQISAATEEMSASTQEMADTCQDLSSQATEQSELARESADDAGRILSITTTLADGAQVAAERGSVLAETANEHRGRLLEGSKKLADLASDLERGAADAKRLTALSEEIQQFLTQAKTIATQTNMLALNAAIEASRAGGGEGRGFAVVADEVRKLANQAARSAATTSDVVRNVLQTVQETQTRLENLAEASVSVRQVAESAAGALEEVAAATAESSAWSDEISRAAGEVKSLVEEITKRLEKIAVGTESVVAASEEIAASAEQQSASTEQIAASASQLANAADRLTATVGSFRLAGAIAPPGPPKPDVPQDGAAESAA
ncbi:MAG: methyl-accepting chemotaxis protein [Gemmatimonadales bacterium]|jgi:methyl-accepting chemotaxis protein